MHVHLRTKGVTQQPHITYRQTLVINNQLQNVHLLAITNGFLALIQRTTKLDQTHILRIMYVFCVIINE